MAQLKSINNFINGTYIPAVSQNYIPNVNPATAEVYSQIADSDRRDVSLAVSAARNAFAGWSHTPVAERARILMNIAALIRENLPALAQAESRDNGKTVHRAATVDIPRAAQNFEFFASAIVHFASESHDIPGQVVSYTSRRPYGVAGCISPWNLPLYLFTWKIAPAIAAGNCVVAKPSEITPVTASMLGEFANAAGLPPGVLNIVHGYGPKVGDAITTHRGIPLISFTGGTATGKQIALGAAPLFKKLSLEMGGKNPVIVFADCDYNKMLSSVIQSSFANQGQICLCGSRIFVERSLYERFRSDFVERVAALQVGDPELETTDQGAIVSKNHYEKILSAIQLAREEGGKILCGGEAVHPAGRCAKGWFIQPTVVEGLSYDCRTNQEEIFGPLVTIAPFDDEAEVLKYANSTEYGLCATVWTSNLGAASRLSEQLEAGIVWVNCWLLRDLRTPFGGVKNSGIGREGGWEALRFFTEPKTVCIEY